MKFLHLFFLMSIAFAQSSRIELKSHFSSTLGVSKQYNIFLPAGYDGESNRYPVVYLFRGAVDEWADPAEDASRQGNIKTVFDTLYDAGKVGKMILVMPGLSAPATPQEYQYLINDLIPFIDSAYRTIPSRWHRSMDGFSLGGLIVTNLMATVPNYFCSVGSYDGTLSLFDNSLFTNASPALIYSIKQMQLLYHTAVIGGNNSGNNTATFSILNSKGIFNTFPSFPLQPNAMHNWYNADWHMALTLPLHWEKMNKAANQLQTALITHFEQQPQSGTITPQWQSGFRPAKTRTILLYSSDNGTNWNSLLNTQDSIVAFPWNTTSTKDGTLYKIKVLTVSDTLFGTDESNIFTINNPGNGSPDIELRSFQPGEIIRDSLHFMIYAGDADGDSLIVGGDISPDNGISWQTMFQCNGVQNVYEKYASRFPNSSLAKVRAWSTDRQETTYTVPVGIILDAPRTPLPGSSVHHVSGNSTAGITVNIANTADITGHTYHLSFRNTSGKKVYDVFDISTSTTVVSGATEFTGNIEGPLFDGIRLSISDIDKSRYLEDSSGWNDGTTLEYIVSLIDLTIDNVVIPAYSFPFDYDIKIFSAIVDTSLAMFDAPAVPATFTVMNVTTQKKTPFVFLDNDGDHSLSLYDDIYLFQTGTDDTLRLSWRLSVTAGNTVVNPVAGSIFHFISSKPLTVNDVYEFTTTATSVGADKNIPLRYWLSQNYPNPFNPATAIRFSVPSRQMVSLTVFDILGRTVSTLVNNFVEQGVTTVAWHASSFSSGVYFYRLQTDHFTQIRKMVLLK